MAEVAPNITPTTDPDLALREPYLLIRHAKSEANQRFEEEYVKAGRPAGKYPHFVSLCTDLSLVDSRVTQGGEQQLRRQHDVINQIKIKAVLVSPLRRALESCRTLFESHPARSAIPYVVVPLASEGYIESSCFTVGKSEIKREFGEMHGQAVDFSLWDAFGEENGDIFQILQLENQALREELLRAVQPHAGEYARVQEVLAQVIREKFPTVLEEWRDMLHRTRKLNAFMAQFLAENPVRADEHIAVIGHAGIFRCLTFTELQENNNLVCDKTFLNGSVTAFTPRPDSDFAAALN